MSAAAIRLVRTRSTTACASVPLRQQVREEAEVAHRTPVEVGLDDLRGRGKGADPRLDVGERLGLAGRLPHLGGGPQPVVGVGGLVAARGEVGLSGRQVGGVGGEPAVGDARGGQAAIGERGVVRAIDARRLREHGDEIGGAGAADGNEVARLRVGLWEDEAFEAARGQLVRHATVAVAVIILMIQSSSQRIS